MNVRTILMLMVVIAGIFFLFTLGASEISQQYPDSNIDSSAWADKYDKSSEIDDDTSLLRTQLETLQDQNNGWFTRIGAGILAIPIAVVTAVATTLSGMTSFVSIVTGIFSEFSLPAKFLSLAISFISIFIVYKLVSFFGKGDI